MAEAKKPEAAAEGEEVVPKKKSKLLLIIIIGVLVLVLGGGAAFLLLKKSSADEEAEDGDGPPAKSAKAKKKKDAEAPPVFVKLEPFIVKLQSGEQESYVQTLPELRLLDALVADRVKLLMPEIRHKVLMILAGKKPSDLATPEGLQLLANQIRVSINASLTGDRVNVALEKQDIAEPGSPVQAVFFSSLIVQ
ncbi:MAG: flagellar basal body-associated FliL family protein [Gammaproteobacteria bacterium]|nr:flagellar basal body protein FliL [Rhodocyclaceae bacterium]MBU3909538.1 flagellar basal body-associated FliL family protein [Gammaproteobacteria bacterium]MBU3987936.1 flagellar basal body-associated FliL family protein [Gammaproteobacteria bacterium]MBU4003201.1 flagellar basal body-associated FliL family protein [Gammaproteobacteria bacterium]MBU4022250.1 flagellar basal body-associated FliL family protein [Gammaproteobacteria bacterium]